MLLLLVLTAAFKVGFQFDHAAHDPLAAHPVSDEGLYMEKALALARGEAAPPEVFHTAPLYPYLLAPFFGLFGPDPLPPRLFQALLGTCSVLLLYLAARAFFPRPLALAAAAAMVLYHPFTFFEGKLLITTSAVFFCLLFLALAAWKHRLPFLRCALVAGIAAGAAAALRPNLLLLAPPAALYFLFPHPRRKGFFGAALFLAGTALPIFPFTLHNLRAEGTPVLLSDNGGINFYLGNNPEARGSFHVTDPAWSSLENQYRNARTIAERETGASLTSSMVSRYWIGRALGFITGDPAAYGRLLCRKLKSFVENFEYGILYVPSVERRLIPTLWIAFLPYTFYLALAVPGLLAFFLSRRTLPAGRAWFPVLLLAAVTLLSVLLFFNYSRFRLPAVPAFILLGILGLREGAAWIRSGRWRPAAAGGALAAVTAILSIFPAGDQWKLQSAHSLSTLGDAYARARAFAEAERWYTKALSLYPGLDMVLNKRGRVRLELGEFEGAKADLEAAVRRNPAAPSHGADLAALYARNTPYRDLDRALALVRQAAEEEARTPEEAAHVRFMEGNVRMARGEYGEAARAYARAFALDPREEEMLFLEGTAWTKAGEEERAREAFGRLLERNPDHAGARKALGLPAPEGGG